MTHVALIAIASLLTAAADAGEELPPVPAAPEMPSDVDSESSSRANTSDGILQGKVEALEEQFIENKAIVSALSKIKVSGYIQARYTYLDSALPASSFFIRRGRVKTEYQGSFTSYTLQVDATNTAVQLRDAIATLTEPFSHKEMVSLSVGQMQLRFGYECFQSSREREFPERSRMVQAFIPGERDRGVNLNVKWKALRANVGVFDGNGINNTSFFGKDNDNEKDIIGRIGADFGFLTFGASGWWGKTLQPADASKGITAHFHPRNRIGADAQLYLDVLPFGATAIKAEFIAGTTFTSGGQEQFGKTALGWYVLLVQKVFEHGEAGFRYDFFDPATGIPNAADSKNPNKMAALNQLHTLGVMAGVV